LRKAAAERRGLDKVIAGAKNEFSIYVAVRLNTTFDLCLLVVSKI